MKRASLPAIRSRVDRLARQCDADSDAENVVIYHWLQPYDNCQACGYNLDAHARDKAITNPRSENAAASSGPRIIFYHWPSMLGTCPKCGASLT